MKTQERNQKCKRVPNENSKPNQITTHLCKQGKHVTFGHCYSESILLLFLPASYCREHLRKKERKGKMQKIRRVM